VLRYLYACLRHRALPWNFFQLNSRYFNETKGIFSKLEMDDLVPEQWRLQQYYLDEDQAPGKYPVFIKPEWGQNSKGIVRIDTEQSYRAFARQTRKTAVAYIVQEAAVGREEYEIYYLRSPIRENDCAVFSITRVTNSGHIKSPINSVHNPDTAYVEITSTFAGDDLLKLWRYVKTIGTFRMARVCVKADTREALLQGRFQVVEINLFLPMPLVLLAENVKDAQKQRLAGEIMTIAARLVKTIPPEQTGTSIFFRKMKAHYGMTP